MARQVHCSQLASIVRWAVDGCSRGVQVISQRLVTVAASQGRAALADEMAVMAGGARATRESAKRLGCKSKSAYARPNLLEDMGEKITLLIHRASADDLCNCPHDHKQSNLSTANISRRAIDNDRVFVGRNASELRLVPCAFLCCTTEVGATVVLCISSSSVFSLSPETSFPVLIDHMRVDYSPTYLPACPPAM